MMKRESRNLVRVGRGSLTTIRIGLRCWVLNPDVSVYDESQKYVGRGKWQQYEVVDETRDSWIINMPAPKELDKRARIPKNEPYRTRRLSVNYSDQRLVLWSEKDVEEWYWMRENKPTLLSEVGASSDPSFWRAVEKLLKEFDFIQGV